MKYTFKNAEIYDMVTQLKQNPLGETTYIPVIYNFYIQKNIKKLFDLAEEIETCRMSIINKYGEDDGNGKVQIKNELLQTAQTELQHLASISQSVELYTIPLHAIAELSLTTGELRSLMPMIIVDDETEQAFLRGEGDGKDIVITSHFKGDMKNEIN